MAKGRGQGAAKASTAEPTGVVAEVFADYPPAARKKLLAVRKLILHTAEALGDVGELTETLKWGEPSYLTEQSKSGSTIRIAWQIKTPEHYGLYFNCQTTLVDTYRTLFPELNFQGSRALLLDISAPLPTEALTTCISLALTYHRDKRKRA